MHRRRERSMTILGPIHGMFFLAGLFPLPVLIQRFGHFRKPSPVLDLFQQFKRGKEFDTVRWRISQRLEDDPPRESECPAAGHSAPQQKFIWHSMSDGEDEDRGCGRSGTKMEGGEWQKTLMA